MADRFDSVLIDWSYIREPYLFSNHPKLQKYRFYVKTNPVFIVKSNSSKLVTFRRNLFKLYAHYSTKGKIVGYEIIVGPNHVPVATGACLYLLHKQSKNQLDTKPSKPRFNVEKVEHFGNVHVASYDDRSFMFIVRPIQHNR